jgi:hypothetical protein
MLLNWIPLFVDPNRSGLILGIVAGCLGIITPIAIALWQAKNERDEAERNRELFEERMTALTNALVFGGPLGRQGASAISGPGVDSNVGYPWRQN